MLSIKTVILIFFWAALGSSNIWDNILSQTLSPSPILLSESIHAKFRVPNYEMDGLVDLNV